MTQEQIPDQTASLPDTPLSAEESSEQPPETDWKAENEALKADKEKMEQRLKSLEGRVNSSDSINDRFAEIANRFDTFETTMFKQAAAQAEAFQSESLDSLAPSLEAIQQEHTTSINQRRSQAALMSLRQSLDEAVLDGEGNAVFDLNTAPELQEARDKNDEAIAYSKAGNAAMAELAMTQAISFAERARVRQERAIAKKALDDLKNEFSAERDSWAEQNGVGDMSTGGESASGAITADNIDALMANIAEATPEQQKQIKAKYRELIATGRLG